MGRCNASPRFAKENHFAATSSRADSHHSRSVCVVKRSQNSRSPSCAHSRIKFSGERSVRGWHRRHRAQQQRHSKGKAMSHAGELLRKAAAQQPGGHVPPVPRTGLAPIAIAHGASKCSAAALLDGIASCFVHKSPPWHWSRPVASPKEVCSTGEGLAVAYSRRGTQLTSAWDRSGGCNFSSPRLKVP